MADDDLTKALDEIRQRDKAVAMGHVRNPDDVPRLLAVVDELLKIHTPTRFVHPVELCAKHARWHGSVMAVIECPDCRLHDYDACERCRDDDGVPERAENCHVRQAISAALLGKAGERP